MSTVAFSRTALGVSTTIDRALSLPTISAAASTPGPRIGDRGPSGKWVSDAMMCTRPFLSKLCVSRLTSPPK